MNMAPILGYWSVRGLGQPIRLLLAFTETEYEDKQYAYRFFAPDYDHSTWSNEKYTLGLDFPNLPYYIDGDVKLTQSIAILRYLARKLKLEPESEEDKIRSDLIEQQIRDIHLNFSMKCWKPEFLSKKELKEEYIKNLPNVLKPVSDFLGKRRFFASENQPTYVDFLVYETLDRHVLLDPDCLNNYPNLKDFTKRIEELPTVKKYLESSNFLQFQLNGDMAYFGSKSSKK